MIHEISLSRHLVWLILRNCLGRAENINTIIGRSIHDYDTDIYQSLSAGLHNCQYINYMKIIGAMHD